MRGTVLAFDSERGEGRITGEDGNRYGFGSGEWHGRGSPAPNQKVDFETADRAALAIYPIATSALALQRNRVGAGLLAIFLGALGAHKFYIGKPLAGIVMLVISVAGVAVAGIPTALMAVIGIVEGVLYLRMSEARFDATYVDGPRSWF